MWDCECGCQAIIVAACPVCGKDESVAKVTSGGYSNAELEGQQELPYEGQDAQVDGEAAVPDDVPDDVPDEDNSNEVEGDYSTYTVRDLVKECQKQGISYSGPNGTLAKDELVSRLNEAKAAQPQE